MCCSTLTLGQKNTKKQIQNPTYLKKEKEGGERKISERSHLFFFRALSNYSKTYFLPGLSYLKETVFPVVTAKGFGVG